MAEIIKERERKYIEEMELNFYTKDTNEICFGFPVINGEIIPCTYAEKEPCSEEECTWWKNYIFAKENENLYSRMETRRWSYMEPAVAICECGKEITLNYDAEECEYCGRLHNLFGQELRPRSEWLEPYDPEDYYYMRKGKWKILKKKSHGTECVKLRPRHFIKC